jgi:excisionase family DNA binding protein
MRVRDVALRLEVSRGTVYQLVASGKLRCYRVGLGRGRIRISEEHLAEFLSSAEPHRMVAPPPPTSSTTQVRLKHIRI